MTKQTVATEDALAQSLIESIASVTRQLRSQKLPTGLTRERLSILGFIAEKGPISVTDLSTLARVKGPTMSRMTSSLIEEGLAKRQVHRSDGRGVLISLTCPYQ